MTSEELKETISMRQVVEQYGIKVNRAGMCCCPIHNERHPSMKIYKDSYFCFACGASGDIFTFTQAMEGCDFKTAYLSLGGHYKDTSEREKAVAKLSRDTNKNKKNAAVTSDEELRQVIIMSFGLIKKSLETDIPFSDRWCESQNFHPILSEWWEEIDGREIDKVHVYTKCREFIKRYDSLSGTNN